MPSSPRWKRDKRKTLFEKWEEEYLEEMWLFGVGRVGADIWREDGIYPYREVP